jgi:aminobenzoyl-glutamate utilization protein B
MKRFLKIMAVFAMIACFFGLPAIAQDSPQQTLFIKAEEVLNEVDEVAPRIEEVSHKLWEISEVSLLETKSSDYLLGELKSSGFKIISEGTSGVPTAFVAEYGSGQPVLGIMLEYDALPGLGNKALPHKEEREDSVTAGHACGHNLIGSGAFGAALTIKNLMEEYKIPGTLRVYGGAAEETEGAKVYMARDGQFDDVDAMLHWHPLNYASVFNIRTAAQSQMYVEFTGKNAHAGFTPWLGRSALDGVEQFLHGLNLMREHVRPTARIHYVIKKGGEAPNIVPKEASVVLTFRDESRAYVEEGVAWIKQIAKGAAMATQTKVIAVDYYGMYDLLPNTPLAERMQEHLQLVGLPEYTEEEMTFASELQKSAGLEQTGMTKEIKPIPQEPTTGGSTDVGDVSWQVPTMGVLMPTVPEGIAMHSWMATASHGTSIGVKGAVSAAKVLALTGIDLLVDPDLLEAAKSDFEKRTEGFEYKSPIDSMILEPVGLPDEMRSHGSVLDLKHSFIKQAQDDDYYGGSGSVGED